MMKTYRKLMAMVLLLLIHLLTLQIGDAGRNDHTNVTNAKSDPKFILEEVIIAGSGNNTRVIANAVAEDASELDDDILSLLSKRETRRDGHSSLGQDDQTVAQSRDTIVDPNEEDDLEVMSRVIAKYEPQRLTSRKTKRKIIDGTNGTHDAHEKVAGYKKRNPLTDFERTYADVLRNISREASKLSVNTADVTLNPYLSQAMKQLKQVHTPEVIIHSAANDGTEKSAHTDVDSSFASPALSKKSKRLLKKYSQLNRTATTPRFSSVDESKSDEKSAGAKESSASALKISAGKTKLKNGLLTSSIHSDPTEKLNIQTIKPFILRLNNSNSNNINLNNLKNLNVPYDTVQLPPRYNVIPRPFSTLQSPNSFVTANVDASYRKPSSLLPPTSFNHQQQTARSSANVLPLVLPTDLFNPLSARRYVPIKRTNHLNLDGNSATIVSTEANLPTSSVGERTTFANYDALRTTITGTTRSPLVTVNGQQSSSDYYAITESPTERTATRTNFAASYIPSQTKSALYAVQPQKDSQVRNDLLPGVVSYSSPNNEKSSLNENPGIALYNKFASLYSTNIPNVFNAPKAITQDFRQPVQSSQQVSTLPYATLKPLTPTLKVRPITPSKPAPYYDGRLLVSQHGKYNANNDENDDETNGRSRIEAANETKAADYNDDDDNDDVGNYKTQSKIHKTPYKRREKEEEEEDRYPQQSRSHGYHQDEDKHHENDRNDDNDDVGNYKTQPKVHKTPNKQREEKEEEEDRYPQQSRNYGYQDKDKHHENDDRREKYDSIRHENDDDEEEADETEEEEYVSIEKSKNEDKDEPRHRYTKYEYDTDNHKKKQHEKPRDDRKKYNESKSRDKHDYESDVDRAIESSNKYFKSLSYNDDDEIRRPDKGYRSDKKKSVDDNRYKKDRRDRKYEESENESVDDDKLYAQGSKDQRVYRQGERYEDERSNDDDNKREYRYQISPQRGMLRERHEEYEETNPTHIREEYHHRDVIKNDPGHDHGNQDDNKEKVSDHVHGETQEHAHKHEKHHEKEKGGDHHFEKGGGAEHEEGHHGHEGEKDNKGYKIWHEHEKAEKGHHDKEQASKQYDEKGGAEKKHEEDGGYHKEHHQGEEGKKTAEFDEKGEHKKGHSTHGEHSVHKKDEYEKKTEFFDEFHEDGGMEKHGEHHHDHESKKGGHTKKGHHDAADHEEKYGKKEKHEKGGHHHEHKGHKVDEGHDHRYDHDQKYGKKEGHEHGTKWSYKKGDDGGDAGGGHKHNR